MTISRSFHHDPMPIASVLRRAVVAIALALVPAMAHAQSSEAYTLDDIVRLLKRRVPSTRVLHLAKENCISFVVTPDVARTLERAGATAALVSGLEETCSPSKPKPAADSAARVAVGAAPVPQPAAPPPPPPPPVDTMVMVHIRAAVIDSNFVVRPLPQMDLFVISPRGDTARVSTDLEGKVDRSFRQGVYRIESVQPVDVGSSRYRWGFFQAFQSDMPEIALTQRNAMVEALPPRVVASVSSPAGDSAAGDSGANAKPDIAAAPVKKPRTEKEIFEDLRSGVFTVYGNGRGSGFLVDSAGLVATNAHLVSGVDEVRVQVDSVTALRARRVAVNDAKDIAILAIDPARCASCAVLAVSDSAAPTPGDRVLALGSPLNKLGVLSLGIVSNADAQSVVSDVSVSWLNTGGPLVNMDGAVIGLNTNHGAAAPAGARVATSVSASDLAAALATARDSIPALRAKPPSDSLLPIVPRDPFPPEPIKAVSGLGNVLALQNYRAEIGPFRVFMMTPQVMAWREVQAQHALADKKRDDPKKAATWTQIDPIEGWRDWQEFLVERKAVVVFNVTPEKTQFPYYDVDRIQSVDEGSFRDMKLYRDGVEIVPVEKVRVPAVLNVEQTKAAGKAIPIQGIYIYRIQDFAPRAVGTVATYTVTLFDQTNPAKPYKLTLQSGMIEQMWKDFTPYRFGAR